MAFKRRSLALTLIAVGFAAQWIPWARIDRAAFQYHYYTALPFVVMSLAYFFAELWHGASRHTWALARVAAAVAIVAPAAMWLLDRPLCAVVGVERVNPGSQACPAVIPEFVLTVRTLALAIVIGIGLFFIVRRFLAFESTDGREIGPDQMGAAYRSLFWTGLGVAVALVVVSLLPDTAILTLTNIPVEPIALVVGIPLGYLALQVMAFTRCQTVRRRVRGGGRRLVRDPLPEHQRPAAPGGRRGRVPGHPADLPVRLPVPGQHRHPERRTRRSSHRPWRCCCLP